MTCSYNVGIHLSEEESYDIAIEIGRKVFPYKSIIRCFRNKNNNELFLLITSELSPVDLTQLTGISMEKMEMISGKNPFIDPVKKYLRAHSELVPEHPNNQPTATFLK